MSRPEKSEIEHAGFTPIGPKNRETSYIWHFYRQKRRFRFQKIFYFLKTMFFGDFHQKHENDHFSKWAASLGKMFFDFNFFLNHRMRVDFGSQYIKTTIERFFGTCDMLGWLLKLKIAVSLLYSLESRLVQRIRSEYFRLGIISPSS